MGVSERDSEESESGVPSMSHAMRPHTKQLFTKEWKEPITTVSDRIYDKRCKIVNQPQEMTAKGQSVKQR